MRIAMIGSGYVGLVSGACFADFGHHVTCVDKDVEKVNSLVGGIIRNARPDADFVVVSNPEFLREGSAIQDFKHPDRIVVGTDDARARAVMAELYRPLYLNAAPILYVNRRTAELIKYAANAFLAT